MTQRSSASAREPRATLTLVALEMRRERVERGRVLDLEAEEPNAFAAVGIHDDALLTVVHAQREARAGLVDELHAEQAGAVVLPVLEIPGAHTDVSE